MANSLDQAAKELFQILLSYQYTLQLFDEDGSAVEEPEDARRMFAKKQNLLLSIIDDGENSSVNVSIGKYLNIHSIEGLIQSLRTACTKYLLNFHVKRYNKEINPKNVDTIDESKRGNTMTEQLFEGLYGTAKKSYLQLESARLIIEHSSKVDETKHGARTRCIEKIFVENDSGERMLFPTRNLLPARSMAQHVSVGGGFADQVGMQIQRMATDFSNLGAASQHILNNSSMLPESAGAVRDSCKKKMSEMRKVFEKMCRPNGYVIEAAKILEKANTLIEGEDEDDVVSQDTIDEVRQSINLEGVDLSDTLVESVARALMEFESLADLKKAAKLTVSILGKLVDSHAWAELCAKPPRIELIHNISDRANRKTASNDEREAVAAGYTASGEAPKIPTKSQEMLVKLEELVPNIKDDSLMNFMSFVVSSLSHKDEMDQEKRKKMWTIASVVLKAAGMMNDIPMKSAAVKEYVSWLDALSTKSFFVSGAIFLRSSDEG